MITVPEFVGNVEKASMVKNVRNPVRIHVHHACRRQGSVFPVETAGLVRTVSSNVSSAFLAKYKAEFAQPANQPNGDPIAKTTARATVTFVVYTMGNASNVLGDFTVRTVKRGVPTASEAFVVQQLEPVILAAKRGITERIVKTLVHPIAKSVIEMMGLARWRNLLNKVALRLTRKKNRQGRTPFLEWEKNQGS